MITIQRQKWYLEELKTFLIEHAYQSHRVAVAIRVMNRMLDGPRIHMDEIREVDRNMLEMRSATRLIPEAEHHLHWDVQFKRGVIDATRGVLALLIGGDDVERVERKLTTAHIAWRMCAICRRNAIKLSMSEARWKKYVTTMRAKVEDLVRRKRRFPWRVE